MHRSSGANTLHRSYAAGGSRTIIDEVDDKSLMQTMKGNAMKGESRKDVESPQNYGFTSCVMPADKGKDGQIEGSAEGFMSYMGGNRSFPVCTVMDDRRHRLKELGKGDSAMYRTKDDRQQFHLADDGNYMTARNDRKQRIALVDPPKDEQQQQQETRGGGPDSGGGQQDDKEKKKATGQKSAKEDNVKSSIAFEQNGKETYSQHGQYYASQRGGSDSSTYYDNRKKSTQATQDHVHVRFEDNRIWVDVEGHWSESPIMQKKDKHCKE